MFSWRPIMTPPEVLDYVAAHEVAHLAQMNHPAFWAEVTRIYGDYQAPRQWLRDHGGGLLSILGQRGETRLQQRFGIFILGRVVMHHAAAHVQPQPPLCVTGRRADRHVELHRTRGGDPAHRPQ